MHQYIEEALKHPSAVVLVRNFHCLLHGTLKKQLPDITFPCPDSNSHLCMVEMSHSPQIPMGIAPLTSGRADCIFHPS